MDLVGFVRAGLGILLLMFVPGYAWMRVLAPLRSRSERFVIAVGLSICLMVLALYLGSIAFGIPLSATHAIWYSLFLTLLAVAVPVSRWILLRVPAR